LNAHSHGQRRRGFVQSGFKWIPAQSRGRTPTGRDPFEPSSIRIATPEGFGTYFLAPLLNKLTQAHPELEIELVAVPGAVSLFKREADLAQGNRAKEWVTKP
jgi:DNA-binding transcriptional LysR family regulator